ncbi:MAG: beta-1,6-N-acetylglucosaminyltransferase [Mangrovicoccus sp.]
MSVGFVLLAHENLERAAQTALALARQGAPVYLHLDRCVPKSQCKPIEAACARAPQIKLLRLHHCGWGGWSLVAAARDCAALLFRDYPKLSHVYLISGACLPLRSVEELRDHLAPFPRRDYIQSVIAAEADWTKGGLDVERFSRYFPFDFHKQRRLFDRAIDLQRRFRIERKAPKGIRPCLGSQWWCLSRSTFHKILSLKSDREVERFFKASWIPDEGYFQTLARRYSKDLEGDCLSWAQFDARGRPIWLYDDHLTMLRQSPKFFARKAWPGANWLYDAFVEGQARAIPIRQARETPIDGGSQERPARLCFAAEKTTPGPKYTVLLGADIVFSGLQEHLARTFPEMAIHGRIFAPKRAEFANGQGLWPSGQSNAAQIRDANPAAFLNNLLRAGPRNQLFFIHPDDAAPALRAIALDARARIFAIPGAWSLDTCRSHLPIGALSREFGRLQKREGRFLDLLTGLSDRAQAQIVPLAESATAFPLLSEFIAATSPGRQQTFLPLEARSFADLPQHLAQMRDAGMNPRVRFSTEDLHDASLANPQARTG